MYDISYKSGIITHPSVPLEAFLKQKYSCNTKKTFSPIYIGYFIVCVFFIAFFYLFFSQMPIGDDISSMFKNSINDYLDDFKDTTTPNTEMVTSFKDILSEIMQQYMVWHARIIPKIVHYTSMLSPPIVSSLFNPIILLLICLVSSSLICDCRLKEVFNYPLSIAYIGIIGIWYSKGIDYIRMQIFLSMYALPALCFLVYYKSHRNLLKVNYSTSKAKIATLTIFGIITGSMHEVFSIYVLIWVILEMMVPIYHKKISIKKMLFHTGYLFGLLSCMLAPGNFYRLGQSHEETISNSLYSKLYSSLSAHFNAVRGNGMWISDFLTIFTLILALSVFIIRVKKIGMKSSFIELLSDTGSYIVIFIGSILIWSVFGYMPKYALFFPRLIYCISLALYVKNNYPSQSFRSEYNVLASLSLCLLFIILNYGWLSQETKVTLLRQKLINKALLSNDEMVIIPAYNEVGNFSLFSDTNDHHKKFNTPYSIQFYGTHLIVKE